MTPDEKQKPEVHIRWMIRRDMAVVEAIEAESFEFPWLEEDFIRCLRQSNCIGMVAVDTDDCDDPSQRVLAFMIYELHKTRINILNFAVAADCRRRGVGSQMAAKMVGKLSPQRRKRLVLEVRESNLPAQLFWREMGFRCVKVLRNFYDESYTPEDAYVLKYRLGQGRNKYCVTNRIAKLRRYKV